MPLTDEEIREKVIRHDYEFKADALFEEILLEIENSSKTRNMIRGVQFYTKYVR